MAWLRKNPLLSAALLLAMLANLAPLWLADMLPSLDLPQHLATVRILRDLHTKPWNLDAYYQLDLAHTQYIGWYLAAVALSQLVSIEIAAKLLLTAYFLLWPLAFLLFLRAHRRQPAFALLAVPLAWNNALWLGYVNYLTALPLVFLWLALWQMQLEQESRRKWIALALLPILVYFLHVQAFLHAVLLVGLTVLCLPGKVREGRTWRLLLHLLPAVLLFTTWALTSAVLSDTAGWKATRAGHNVPSTALRFLPWKQRFVQLPWNVSDIYHDFADAKLMLALLLLAVLAFLAGWLQQKQQENQEHPGWLPEIGLLASLLVYFFAPIQFKWIYSINSRTVPIIALLLLATLARFRPPRAGLLVLLPGLALALTLASLHAERLPIFSLEATPARHLLAKIPQGQRGVGLIYNPASLVATHFPFLHFAQYGVLDRGGMADFSFANFPQSPVVFVPPGPPQLPERFEKHPDRFTMASHGRWYDWYLVRDFGPEMQIPLVLQAGTEIELVGREGNWQMYRRVK